MKTEDKELLLRDLSGRLPYGVKCKIHTHVHGDTVYKLTDIRDNGYTCGTVKDNYAWAVLDISGVKPFLFPLSSMTEEQKDEIKKFFKSIEGQLVGLMGRNVYFIDFCNKNHLDYRGLIPMGLALDATGLNIYKEG